jgi:hypothetical protein
MFLLGRMIAGNKYHLLEILVSRTQTLIGAGSGKLFVAYFIVKTSSVE